VLQSTVVEISETGNRAVGVRERLEVRDEPGGSVFLPGPIHPSDDLFVKGFSSLNHGPGPGPPVVAVDAPAPGNRPVPVRTGESGIQRDFLNPISENLPKIGIVRSITGRRTSHRMKLSEVEYRILNAECRMTK
jgi:hypothetical protein